MADDKAPIDPGGSSESPDIEAPVGENLPSRAISNILPRGRRVRIGVGVVMITAGIFGVGLMWIAHLDPVLRLAYFPTFWLASLGVFQAWENTCVVLATKGVRETAAGIESVSNPGDLAVIRCQSQRVHLHSLLVAALLTALALALP